MGFEIPSNLSFLSHPESPCTDVECKKQHHLIRFSYHDTDLFFSVTDYFHNIITNKLKIRGIEKFEEEGKIKDLRFKFQHSCLVEKKYIHITYTLSMDYSNWKPLLDKIKSLYQEAIKSTPLITHLQDIVFSYLDNEDEFNLLLLSRMPTTWLADLCIPNHWGPCYPMDEKALVTLKKDLKIAD